MLRRVSYPGMRPGESMTDDLLAGYADFFNFTERKPRSTHRPRWGVQACVPVFKHAHAYVYVWVCACSASVQIAALIAQAQVSVLQP